jgi:hypothetical protein
VVQQQQQQQQGVQQQQQGVQQGVQQQQQQVAQTAALGAIATRRQQLGAPPTFAARLNFYHELQQAGTDAAATALGQHQAAAAAAAAAAEQAAAAAQQAAVNAAVAAVQAQHNAPAQPTKARYLEDGTMQLPMHIGFKTYEEAGVNLKVKYLEKRLVEIGDQQLPHVFTKQDLKDIFKYHAEYNLRFVMEGNDVGGFFCGGQADITNGHEDTRPELTDVPVIYAIVLDEPQKGRRIGMAAADCLFREAQGADMVVADIYPGNVPSRHAIGRAARRNGRHWKKRAIGVPQLDAGTDWDAVPPPNGYARYCYAKYGIDVRQRALGRPSTEEEAESEEEDEVGGPAGGGGGS